MKRRRLAILVCFGALASGAWATDTDPIEHLSQRLQSREGVQGKFRQEKHLSFIQVPLVSNGSFFMPHENCLVWRVDAPAASEMTVRAGSVFLDGEAVNDRGIGRMIAMLIHGLMSGDMSQLSQRFSIEWQPRETGWELTLAPQSLLVSQAIQRIEVRGDTEVEKVKLLEPAGTVTVITFTDVGEFHATDEGGCLAGE